MAILAHFLLAILFASSVVNPSVASPGATLAPVLQPQQPTPQATGETGPPRGTLGIVFALLCTFSLSTTALVSSLAIKRRLNRISPDPKEPER